MCSWYVALDSAFPDLPRGVSYRQRLGGQGLEEGLVFETTYIGGVGSMTWPAGTTRVPDSW